MREIFRSQILENYSRILTENFNILNLEFQDLRNPEFGRGGDFHIGEGGKGFILAKVEKVLLTGLA